MADEEEPEREDFDSGPYCRHWQEPGFCDECDADKKKIEEALDILKRIDKKPYEVEEAIRNLETC